MIGDLFPIALWGLSSFALVPPADMASRLGGDYKNTEAMIFGKAPSFDAILASIGGARVSRRCNAASPKWTSAAERSILAWSMTATRRGCVETVLILGPAVAFAVCVHFGVGSSFRLFRGFEGPTVAVYASSSVSCPDFRANEASHAFIAAIIAGMPMMFMTRVIL
ncbi:MAG: hypothetical protein ABJG55_18975 [Paracoccaceae bacterium]